MKTRKVLAYKYMYDPYGSGIVLLQSLTFVQATETKRKVVWQWYLFSDGDKDKMI